MQAKDLEGNSITGIPYGYSELVFDLFYTIEKFPTYLDEEEWKDGFGLYVCRKLLNKQNCLLTTVNGINYTKEPAEPFVKFTITIPVK